MADIRPFRSFKGSATYEQMVDRLRQKAQEIRTRQEFEAILEAAHSAAAEDAIRQLMEPMLPPDLPCCAKTWNGPHTPGCPRRKARAAQARAEDATADA